MKMFNFSPFPNLRFFNSDNTGFRFGVAMVKGTYEVDAGSLVPAREQAPILLHDVYYGELNASSLRYPSDLVAKKPRTDIILNAIARSPGATPRRSWTCGVRIEGGITPFEHRLKVCGPRRWVASYLLPEALVRRLPDERRGHVFKSWVLDEPADVLEVPLRYERAYGGCMSSRSAEADDPVAKAHHYNPLGCGWIDDELTSREGAVNAPQIEDADAPPLEAARHAPVAGFGAIPPAWLPRRPLGGTFDKHWKERVWPNWPADYDFAYNNSANPRMIYPGHLQGRETVMLDGFDEGTRKRVIELPDHRMTAIVDREGATSREMELDTLLLDIEDPDPSEHRAFLTWRTTFDVNASEIAFVAHRGPSRITELRRAATTQRASS